MATPVWCCGAECGVNGITAPHITAFLGTASFSTTTFRSGLRSVRTNPTAGQSAFGNNGGEVTGTVAVGRSYFNIVSAPSTKDTVIGFNTNANRMCGLAYDPADSKWYPGEDDGTTCTIGSQGVSLGSGWHQLDVRVNVTNNPWLIDIAIDGVPLTQLSRALAASTVIQWHCGNPNRVVNTYDIYHDDFLLSLTSADYPLGAGYVLSYIPNADGTHNVAGAADFKHGTGTTPAGTDITNASTDAWQDIDKRPLVTSAAGAETLINMIAPPNATDYVEIQFEDAVEPSPPRAVDVIIGINQAGTGAGNMEVRLNDNGTMGTVYTATGVAGVAIASGVVFKRAQFADPPSAASAWVLGGAGDGDFNDLRIRFGSPAAVDANPDQYLVEVMFEAEFQPALPKALHGRPFGQPGVKLMPQLLAT